MIGNSKNGWKLQEIADGHLSCENFDLSPDDIERIEKLLLPKFGHSMKNESIMVSYDNWSDVFIMQMPGKHTDSSDEVIKNIYEFLSNL